MNSLRGRFTRVGSDLEDNSQTSKVSPHSGSGIAVNSRNTSRSGKDRERARQKARIERGRKQGQNEVENKDRTRSKARIERGRKQG